MATTPPVGAAVPPEALGAARRAFPAAAPHALKAALEAAAPHIAAAERERLLSPSPGPKCCDLHGRNCEPSGDLCCENCTEVDHPGHTQLRPCSTPVLSPNSLEEARRIAVAVAAERERLYAELGNDHYVIFTDDRWTIEHSVECRLSGHMHECEYHTAVARIAAEFDPGMAGRWLITAIDLNGEPALVRADLLRDQP